MKNLLQMAAELMGTARDIEAVRQIIIEKAVKMLFAEVRRGLSGQNVYVLPALSDGTIERKGNDLYLMERGALIASLRAEVGHEEGWVYSNDPKIAFLEFGTSKMPPRPVFLSALHKIWPAVERMAQREVAAAFAGHGANAAALGELFHLAHKVAHAIKEQIEEMLEPADEDDR